MIIFRLGWRNLWRNSRRSWITISAIGTAYAILMALTGLTGGMMAQMLRNGTQLIVGHLQIHDSDYLPDRNLYDWLGQDTETNLQTLLARLQDFPEIQAATPRVHGFGLLSTGDQSSGAQIIGIDPGTESQVSSLLGTLVQGELLSESPRRGLLLGDILARSLGVQPGSEVAVVTQAADGTLGNDLYQVTGIVHSGLVYLDRSLALVHWNDLQELLALDATQIHEVAIRINDPISADVLSGRLNASGMLPAGAIAQSWGDLLPQLKDYVQLADGVVWFLISLIGVFAALGVLNTMMMAVFERTREVGTLNSLGMKPFRILSTFLVESFFLALLGLGVGFMVGAVLMYYLSTHGLDLTRWMGEVSMLDTRLDPVLKAVWVWDQFLWSALGLMLAVLLATYIPARRASRMNPVEALRAPTEG
ncbi:FtsX-like permease family protein [Acidobacteria bacterium AH-259-G07]|nr:FtsX-like permease family protein [Acidobacteria bacterium AH-259-G07]